MKLVEILARELKEWPEGFKDVGQAKGGQLHLPGVGEHVRNTDEAFTIADDWMGAIITREMWEAERAKLKKPKANAEGWIRHRGGKCPVEAGTLVDLRYRDGEIRENKAALIDSGCDPENWIHEKDKHSSDASCDIMAYRLHKPEHESEKIPSKCQGRECEMPDADDHSDKCLLDAAIDQGWAGPLQWRDRITEIDSTVEALEEERASLIQRLEDEGFALIKRKVEPVEDMSDPANWRVGDIFKVITRDGDDHGFMVGELCRLAKFYNGDADYAGRFEYMDGRDYWFVRRNSVEWHSRPTS